jgi:hypothetical protein
MFAIELSMEKRMENFSGCWIVKPAINAFGFRAEILKYFSFAFWAMEFREKLLLRFPDL